jgi:hypothetical protein
MRTAAEGLEALSAALVAEGGTLAEVVGTYGGRVRAGTEPGPAQLAAAGPRARGHEAEYELLLEMVREGILLHYGQGRVTPSEDPDLSLLIGDQLYALGLSRLAAMGDLEAVAELADMISLIAQARAAGDDALAEAVWEAGAAAVGWGADPAHEQAKVLSRAGSGQAVLELRRSATRLTARH